MKDTNGFQGKSQNPTSRAVTELKVLPHPDFIIEPGADPGHKLRFGGTLALLSRSMLVLNFSIERDSIALSARKEHQPDEIHASCTTIAGELHD